MLSVGSDRPVDPLTVATMRAIDNAAQTFKLPYFLAGAMARDIILTNVHGINTGLATLDVDFGVAVAGWDEFDRIKARLILAGFSSTDKIAHRLHYRPAGTQTGHPVDIIPFRGVQNPEHAIAWPPGSPTTAISLKPETRVTASRTAQYNLERNLEPERYPQPEA